MRAHVVYAFHGCICACVQVALVLVVAVLAFVVILMIEIMRSVLHARAVGIIKERQRSVKAIRRQSAVPISAATAQAIWLDTHAEELKAADSGAGDSGAVKALAKFTTRIRTRGSVVRGAMVPRGGKAVAGSDDRKAIDRDGAGSPPGSGDAHLSFLGVPETPIDALPTDAGAAAAVAAVPATTAVKGRPSALISSADGVVDASSPSTVWFANPLQRCPPTRASDASSSPSAVSPTAAAVPLSAPAPATALQFYRQKRDGGGAASSGRSSASGGGAGDGDGGSSPASGGAGGDARMLHTAGIVQVRRHGGE
jgi:hypothetical protein